MIDSYASKPQMLHNVQQSARQFDYILLFQRRQYSILCITISKILYNHNTQIWNKNYRNKEMHLKQLMSKTSEDWCLKAQWIKIYLLFLKSFIHIRSSTCSHSNICVHKAGVAKQGVTRNFGTKSISDHPFLNVLLQQTKEGKSR